jgi:hypothetical protein
MTINSSGRWFGRRGAHGARRAAALGALTAAAGCGSLLGIDDVEPDGGAGAAGSGDVGAGAAGRPNGGGGRPGIAGDGGGGRPGGGGRSGVGGEPGVGGQPGSGGRPGAGGRAGGEGVAGAAPCAAEPSDDDNELATATELERITSCGQRATGSVLRPGDADWYVLSFVDSSPDCKLDLDVTFAAGAATAEVCVFARPTSTQVVVPSCPAGFEPSSDVGTQFFGCCGSGRARIRYDTVGTAIDEGVALVVRVAELAPPAACVPYQLTLTSNANFGAL